MSKNSKNEGVINITKLTPKKLKIDEVLFGDEKKTFNIYKRFYGAVNTVLWNKSSYEKFKNKLMSLHTFLIQTTNQISPKKVKWLLRLPNNFKEVLANSPDINDHKKLDLLNFYFDYIETSFEDKLLSTKEGQMLLYQKYYGVDKVEQSNNIQINIGTTNLDINSNAVEVKDKDIDISALGVENGNN